jgi:hypothetical protein
MKIKINSLGIILIVFVFTNIGCATSKYDLSQFLVTLPYVQKKPDPISVDKVRGYYANSEKEAKNHTEMVWKSGYDNLGSISFKGEITSQQDVKNIAAHHGADYYIFSYVKNGAGTGVRYVPAGYITPQLVTTTSRANVCGSGVNLNGYGTSQSLVGGGTIYGRENYLYDSYDQEIYLLISPQRKSELLRKGILSPEAAQHKPCWITPKN